MALANFTELKSSIADYLNRDDLTSVVPTFIALAESQINRDVRHWRMEQRSSGQQSAGDEYSQIPADWLETIRFNVTGASYRELKLISRADMADMRQFNHDLAGPMESYCHAAQQFQFYPTPDADTDVELLYYAKVPDLATNTTNWLLTDAPDVYLYGSLIHSAPYLQDDARLAVWAQLYSAAVARLNEVSDKARYSGSGLKMKLRGLK
jgi:hypothetical protein